VLASAAAAVVVNAMKKSVRNVAARSGSRTRFSGLPNT